MRAVFGVGNPGKRYENTRHNAGFIILDSFAEKRNISFLPSNNDFYISGGVLDSSPFKLIKPTTYVNLCGLAAKDVITEYNLNIEDFLVVYDDVNLKKGNIRLRKSGGSGGHNGISSIIYHLQTDQFPRLRIGIGSMFEQGKMADYVLNKFDKSELEEMEQCFLFSNEIIEEFIKNGFQSSLNYYSRHKQKLKNESD